MVETVWGMTDLQLRLFTAIGQLSLAGGVFYVALRQWLTAREQAATAKKKLKADLFDKRMAALNEVESPIIEILKDVPDHTRAVRVRTGARRFRYLFGNDAYMAAVELGEMATDLANLRNDLNLPHVDPYKRQEMARKYQLFSALLDPKLSVLHDFCTAELTLSE
ncbi:hypothetical protein CR156_06520 [Stenotrophomonas lactitubi]|uniref:hypothetical protein n=1 Tax=Stenotrophomonas TaxID=40323 RepID=UPI0007F86D0B|nr:MULTISPECIES: hypothetical protein [Stenotrophomonas]OBU70205.1 hypothetical protein A9J40_01675 [Stenotrophomonas maltophilia]PJO51874.1 hypothetical protein CR156_06520 [Stenotrophomonas lactitubi]